MKTMIAVIYLVLVSLASAQAPDTLWTRAYYEPIEQGGTDVCEVKGGYVISGFRFIEDNQLYIPTLVKIDGLGNKIWGRTYGDPINNNVPNSLRRTSDNNLIMAGSRYGRVFQVFLSKIQANGTLIWTRTYSPGSGGEAYCVRQANDGGYIIAGNTFGNGFSDVFILKADGEGLMEWTRTFRGPYADEGFGVCTVREGGFALVGYTQIVGGYKPGLLIRYGDNGDTLWSRIYDRGVGDFRAVEQTTDGGFIMAGRSMIDNGNDADVFVVKTNSVGDTLWTRVFGGTRWDGAHSVHQTYDGGYFIGAYTMSFGQGVRFYFIKLDQGGNLLWEKVTGDVIYNWGTGAIQCRDGGYLMAGIQWASEQYSNDICAVKLLPDGYSDIETNPNQPIALCVEQNYPNPFNATTKINYNLAETDIVRLTIYNILGQHVATLFDGMQTAGVHSQNWDASGCPSGLYFAKVTAGSRNESIKMMLMK